jgi:hypothetical protein
MIRHTYRGEWTPEAWVSVTIDGKPLEPGPSLELRNHSPDGFSWGYCGSGPAQLALALLLHETDQETALGAYQTFKAEIVAKLPAAVPWKLTSREIQDWLGCKGLPGQKADEFDFRSCVHMMQIAGKSYAEKLPRADKVAPYAVVTPGSKSAEIRTLTVEQWMLGSRKHQATLATVLGRMAADIASPAVGITYAAAAVTDEQLPGCKDGIPAEAPRVLVLLVIGPHEQAAFMAPLKEGEGLLQLGTWERIRPHNNPLADAIQARMVRAARN